MTNELIALIANVALTLSFIVALVFGIAQVQAAARDRRERLTLDALRNFQSREFAELINYVTRMKMPQTQAELFALPDSEQVILIQFGQEMESLGMLVAERVIDLNLVDKTLGSFVNTSWNRLNKLYSDIRIKSDDPYLCEYYQWLAEQVEKRMTLKPRQPYYVNHHARK
jgi:hypothetical protein